MSKKEKNSSNKHVWIKKSDNLCLVAHTALKVLDTCLWYLDSACSKHMTGDRALLKDIQMGRGGRITFGDGSQAKVIGNGQIDILRTEVSQKALYVEGLKANLLSISQLCDDDLVVQFSKKECNIFDNNGNWLMGGEGLVTTVMAFQVSPQILRSSAIKLPLMKVSYGINDWVI